MQRVATNQSGKAPHPPGSVPFCELEKGIRAAVEQRIASIVKQTREGLAPSWFRHATFWELSTVERKQISDHWATLPRIRELAVRESALVSGIVGHLVERFIEANRDSIALFKDGNFQCCNLDHLLYLADPAEAPLNYQREGSRQILTEFSRNRRCNHAFLDRVRWAVRHEPDVSVATCDDEAEDIVLMWKQFSHLSGAALVFRDNRRTKKGNPVRGSSVLKAAVAKMEEDLLTLAWSKVPRGKVAFAQLVREALLFYQTSRPEAFTRENLATHLGMRANTRTFGKVWHAVLSKLPPEEQLRRDTVGRPRKPTSNQRIVQLCGRAEKCRFA